MITKIVKTDIKEISGAFGDIGIFLPMALGLIYINGLNPFSIFFTAGVMYILSGYYFRHPIPVQPLKALAITAMATGASMDMISAAALLMGVFLLIFAYTDLFLILNRLFSKAIIRGIQFGLGMMLIKQGAALIIKNEYLFHGVPVIFHFSEKAIPLSLLVGLCAVLFAIKFHDNRRIPAALFILGFGILSGLIVKGGDIFAAAIPSANLPEVRIPDFSSFLSALFLLVIPQIPLTIGNSLYGVSYTANDYFGKMAEKTTPKALSFSLGIGNICIAFLGGMPVCHGAGGLTAHYKFGARRWKANLIIGTVFLVVAFVSLSISLSFLYLIPISILGSLLIFTGLEHAMLIKDVDGENELVVVMIIGATAFILDNLFAGCMAGLFVNWWTSTSFSFSLSGKKGGLL